MEEITDFGDEEESIIRDFLLGRLAGPEQERVEQRLLFDPAYSELVSAIESELVDDYTSGILGGDDRRRFEADYLVSDGRRRRVQFSRALARAASQMEVVSRSSTHLPEKRTPLFAPIWLQTLAATLTVAALGSTWWMFDALSDSRSKLQDAEAQVSALGVERERLLEQHRVEREQSAASAARAEQRPPVVAALLTSGALRAPGSEVSKVLVDASTLIIELKLDISEDGFASHVAVIQDSFGNELIRIAELVSEKSATGVLITLQIPKSRLPPGDYSVELFGKTNGELEEMERYYFRVLGA